MTFWAPLSVKEPPPQPSACSARKRHEDLAGHSDRTIRWEGSGPHDDDDWRGRRPRRAIASPRDEKLYIFKPDDGTVLANGTRFGGPRSFDDRDRTAVERRQDMETIPPPPALSERIKNPAGLWPWQQREVKLENRVIRRYAPSKSSADRKGTPNAVSSPRERCAATPPTRTSHKRVVVDGGASSPRRHEVKKLIMAMAERFGV